MTRPSESHLSPDQIDAWLAGTLDAEVTRHVDRCQSCLEQLRAEREMVEQVASLPLLSPIPGFADRVMASVRVPDPFAIRSLQATRRRLLATRQSVAFAASVIEQPWYTPLRALAEQPGRLALVSALITFAYLGGVIVLRRLLALPTQQVAHASI